MSKRIILFGYEYVNGILCVKTEEARVVREVFDRYIDGDTYKKIAENMMERGIPYYFDNNMWNKGIISRMIIDTRYIGDKKYPPIVTKEFFESANSRREKMNVKKVELPETTKLIKSKLFCAECGSRYRRLDKWSTREKWECTGGCKTSVYVDDETLLRRVNMAMKNVCKEYKYYGNPNEYVLNPDITKQENEICRITNVDDGNGVRMIDLILECTSKKFDNCNLNYNEILHKMIQQEYNRTSKENLLNSDLIGKTIDKIYVKTDGKIILKMLSGAEIESA